MPRNGPPSGEEIHAVLNAGRHSPRQRRLRWALATLAVLLLAGGTLLLMPGEESALRYETAEVQQGDLTVTVTATGALEPVNQVDVGSELSGTIETVAVDFNDKVQRGQLLARLDTDRLQAQVLESRASLQSNEAKVKEAQATVQETRLSLERCEKLAERQLCTVGDLDAARAAYTRAKAAEASARAQVAVARATLDGKETELAKAEIHSPIDGLVLLRQIEPGQTVAASLQAPILFTLAEDLSQMELHVAVDEADVGKIAVGQSAVFTVDAWPERNFPARITQVRFAPRTIDGVVTYETLLAVDNSDLSLRPGMTATAVITVQQLQNVVLIPNAALRFTPPQTEAEQTRGGGVFGMLFPRPPMGQRRSNAARNGDQQVWILRDGATEAVAVKTGASDGKVTALQSGDLRPGQRVVVDAVTVKP
ncbi:MAG: efflux RND transporter periplasmic adaptor subunit [Gammaproteobacteria bacterium]|jgi:HlyD family secretion protein|nr:efflux RND transporter periplasmic adaptor subunit [Gammaproteobacteria bacterium]